MIITPIPDPFWPALKGPKFAESSIEELETINEEEQSKYARDQNSS